MCLGRGYKVDAGGYKLNKHMSACCRFWFAAHDWHCRGCCSLSLMVVVAVAANACGTAAAGGGGEAAVRTAAAARVRFATATAVVQNSFVSAPFPLRAHSALMWVTSRSSHPCVRSASVVWQQGQQQQCHGHSSVWTQVDTACVTAACCCLARWCCVCGCRSRRLPSVCYRIASSTVLLLLLAGAAAYSSRCPRGC